MKLAIRSILGGLILFMYQFVSFAAANFHEKGQAYTEKQDTIMTFLNSLQLENKQYVIPRPSPTATDEERQAFATSGNGKPWAMVNYHTTKNTGMAMPMIRGLLVDILAIFLLFGLLDKIADINSNQSILYAVTVGLFSFIVIPYTNHIWYQLPDIWASLLDAIIPYAILGALYARFWRAA
jgi:hypothetical protein